MTYSERRINLVTNPASSNARQVEDLVTRPLTQAKIPYELTRTSSVNASENIEYLAGKIQPGDQVIVASGDGVTNQVANAVEMSGASETQIGALGFGGFNDIASTFTGTGIDAKNPFRLIESDVAQTAVFPLDISFDGTHDRNGILYFAAGFCADASELMDDEMIREKIKNANHGKQLLMGIEAAKRYFFGDKITPMPPYTKTHDTTEKRFENNTDIVATNGPQMARILKSKRDWYSRKDFRVNELDARSLLRSSPFLGKAALNNLPFFSLELPGITTEAIEYQFESPAYLTWQVDGEVSHTTTSKLSVKKTENLLHFLHPAKRHDKQKD